MRGSDGLRVERGKGSDDDVGKELLLLLSAGGPLQAEMFITPPQQE